MVNFLPQVERHESITCFRRSLFFFPFKCTRANHFFDLIACIRAVLARALVKLTLGCKKNYILFLYFFISKFLSQIPLDFKKCMYLFHEHGAAYSEIIGAVPVPFPLPEFFIITKHFTDGAVIFQNLRIGGNGFQHFTFICIAACFFTIRFKAAMLGKEYEKSCPFFSRHFFRERSFSQFINIYRRRHIIEMVYFFCRQNIMSFKITPHSLQTETTAADNTANSPAHSPWRCQ